MENKSIGALWEKKSKTGMTYFSGKCFDKKIVAFKNTKKTNEKQPDYTILESREREQQNQTEVNIDNIIF